MAKYYVSIEIEGGIDGYAIANNQSEARELFAKHLANELSAAKIGDCGVNSKNAYCTLILPHGEELHIIIPYIRAFAQKA